MCIGFYIVVETKTICITSFTVHHQFVKVGVDSVYLLINMVSLILNRHEDDYDQ